MLLAENCNTRLTVGFGYREVCCGISGQIDNGGAIAVGGHRDRSYPGTEKILLANWPGANTVSPEMNGVTIWF